MRIVVGMPTKPHPPRFREVLGHLPTGVTVVTGIDGGKPIGMSCNSFTSVSLEPPLVAFGASRESITWPRIRETGRFAVNVLAHAQEELGRRFAVRGIDRFAGVPWHPSPQGNPLLDGAVAWIDCRLYAEHEAGDHTLILAEVVELDVHEPTSPLVFFRGAYGSFQAPGSPTPSPINSE
jgi:3-hydroxy-9,10-secoandrosta-1,3,5(10)-triene-9,17-dione monooxygenase reductase component